MISKNDIDNGKGYDWGRTSADYALYRDIYPQEIYDKVLSYGLCKEDQKVLDLGTGTGVLPRNMYKYGAKFIGTDISESQIAQAKMLSAKQGMDITYITGAAEELDFPDNTFDVITAFTCFFYFDHKRLMPKILRWLKPQGHLLVEYMSWLPFEDKRAGMSEKLILKYNPKWTGANETRRKAFVPEMYDSAFEKVHEDIIDLNIPFTRESWNGRMKACRGVGASLSEEEIKAFEKEHLAMLDRMGEDKFQILHYAALTDMVKK